MNVIYDPMNTHKRPLFEVLEETGLLTQWAEQGEAEGMDFKDSFNEYYQFGLTEMTGGEIEMHGGGVYKYPQDPPLHPLVEMHNNLGDTCFIYSYGIVGIVKADGKQFITRMD